MKTKRNIMLLSGGIILTLLTYKVAHQLVIFNDSTIPLLREVKNHLMGAANSVRTSQWLARQDSGGSQTEDTSNYPLIQSVANRNSQSPNEALLETKENRENRVGGKSSRGRILQPGQVAQLLNESTHPVARPLAEFFLLNRNLMRSEKEEEAYRQLLSDSIQIRAVGEFLLDSHRQTLDYADEALRYAAVSFLSESMINEPNPGGSPSEVAMKQVIFAENIREQMPRNLKVSLAGDKVELSMQYLASFPQAQQDLLTRSKGINQQIVKRALDYIGVN